MQTGLRETDRILCRAAFSKTWTMGRAPCCNKGLRKGQWTEEEDHRLISYIRKHGHGNWRALPSKAGLQRCGKSCRLRWVNYLSPGLNLGDLTREEEDKVVALHGKLGNKWSEIAAQLPGRTDNQIKNVWNTRLKKRLDLANYIVTDREHETFRLLGGYAPMADAKLEVTQSSSEISSSSTPSKAAESFYQCSGLPCLSEEQPMELLSSITLEEEGEDKDFWMWMLIQAEQLQEP